MNTKEIIDRIFNGPNAKCEFTKFENLDKPTHDNLTIFPKTGTIGRDSNNSK